MEQAEKRKYAQAMRRIEVGVWGYRKSLFRAIHLTTREGDDNSTERFTRDFRLLIKSWRKMGYDVEYCGAMGLYAGKGVASICMAL